MPIFDPLVLTKHGIVVPSRISGRFCEVIPITLVTARPNHHIDARSTTKYFPHGKLERPIVQLLDWTCLESPIALRPKVRGPLAGFLYSRQVVNAAGLEQ